MAAPTLVESYGPNGTHWPNQTTTPFMYDDGTQGNVVNVACTWSAIKTALDAVTDTQANVDGTLILVADGTLSGNGAGEADTAVMSGSGNSAWTQRVTVVPASGSWTLANSETLADIGLPEEPTDAYLEEIWAGSVALPIPIKSSSGAAALVA